MTTNGDGKHARDDLTGRDRITWNVLVAWATQIVSIVIGFILPRLIDESLGQVSLGIWDFGWSLVSYISLANMGLGSNASRFIAGYRAEGKISAMNATASSAFATQLSLTLCLLGAIVYVFSAVNPQFEFKDVQNPLEVQLVVLFLALSIITQLMFDIYRGTLTGYHRFDINNTINAAQQLISAIAMVTVLLKGYGLAELAGVYLLATLAGELLRMICSTLICKELRLTLNSISLSQAKHVSIYGAKNLVWVIGPVSVFQAVNVLIATMLGPAALAVFARPAALMRYVDTFASKFAMVLTPAIGSLQTLGKTEELEEFVVSMSRISWLIAIPATAYLAIFGPEIVTLWMGEDYVNEAVIVALALFRGIASTTSTGYRLLFGMNAHGKLARRGLIFSMLVLVVMVPLFLSGNISLLKAAFVQGILSFGLAGMVMHELSGLIRIPMARFAWNICREAIVVGLACTAVLLSLKYLLAGQVLISIVISGLVHATLVASLYWFLILTEVQRGAIRNRFRSVFSYGN